MPAQIEQFGKGSVWGQIKALANNFANFYVFNGTPVSGVGGTFAGKAGLGASLFSLTTGFHYINLGTQAIPQWSNDGGPQGTGLTGALGSGVGVVGNAKASYDFATDGGGQVTITPLNSPTIPLGAIILGGVLEVTTIPVGVGASIGVGLGSGAQVASILAPAAIVGAPWSTTGMKAIIPIFTAATYIKVAAATKLTFTISAANLTAGQFNINLAFIQGN